MKLKFLLYIASTFSFFSAGAKELPNVVFIFADDMGYGDISCNNPYSRVQTPAIDQLATQGIRFTEAHSAGSVCTPSRYSLLTGRYFFRVPKQPGYWGYLSPYIESERNTIGDLLQKKGYTTACIGKWHLGLNWQKKVTSLPLITNRESLGYTNVDFNSPVSGGPDMLGFDYSFIMPASLDMPPYVFIRNNEVIDQRIIITTDVYPKRLDETIEAWDRKHTDENDVYWDRGVWWRNGEMSESFKIEKCMDEIAREGIAFIEREAKNKSPFFLYLPLTGPHTPWVPNEKFKGSSKLGTYGDFIAQIDDIVAQIVNKLEELGVDDNTMIIFSSDNGAAWESEDVLQYAHQSSCGRKGMKGDAWDGGHHVPLIIKWPDMIKPGSIYNYDVSLVDFYATFAEMTGQNLNNNTAEDSFSFYKALSKNPQYNSRDHILYLSSAGKISIKMGDWKLIQGLGSGGFSYPGRLTPVKNGPTDQLYNMKDDIKENNNLYILEGKIAKNLKTHMEKLINQGYSREINID